MFMTLLFDTFWHVVLKVNFNFLYWKKKQYFLYFLKYLDAKGFETSTTIEINNEKVTDLVLAFTIIILFCVF